MSMNRSELELHVIIAKQVKELEYGQMTINVQLKNGQPILETLNITKSKRKKYRPSSVLTNK